MALAERVRFELTKLFCSLLDFESSAFGHSATSPDRELGLIPQSFHDAKPKYLLNEQNPRYH